VQVSVELFVGSLSEVAVRVTTALPVGFPLRST
jgi:hypothetical protein